jgi:glycerophosphoryl diester phosphodiesterase
VEFKDEFTDENIQKAFGMVREVYDLSKTPLQSFDIGNLIRARALFPELPVMLTAAADNEMLWQAYDLGFSVDMDFHVLTREIVDKFHAAGLEVGAWTANTRAEVSYCLSLGVDYIESDIYAR